MTPLSELCLALALYTGTPLVYADIYIDNQIFTIRLTRHGYSLAGSHGVITADSEAEMILRFRKMYCPEDFADDDLLVVAE